MKLDDLHKAIERELRETQECLEGEEISEEDLLEIADALRPIWIQDILELALDNYDFVGSVPDNQYDLTTPLEMISENIFQYIKAHALEVLMNAEVS